jgi:N-acetylglutamate synthase-like GNAT family acetyltransferase
MSSYQIIAFSPDKAADFDRLNRAWIARYFEVEPFDHEVLTRPDELIIQKGGEIWLAEVDEKIVGTVALITLEKGVFELSKLAVDDAFQGRGIAKGLMDHAKERARSLGVHTIRLLTSTSLIPANNLYKALGYQTIAIDPALKARYKRCDLIYEYRL